MMVRNQTKQRNAINAFLFKIRMQLPSHCFNCKKKKKKTKTQPCDENILYEY